MYGRKFDRSGMAWDALALVRRAAVHKALRLAMPCASPSTGGPQGSRRQTGSIKLLYITSPLLPADSALRERDWLFSNRGGYDKIKVLYKQAFAEISKEG